MWRYRIRCDRAIARKPRCEQEHCRQSTRKKFGRHKRRRHDACALGVRNHEFNCPQREHGKALAEPLHSRWKSKMMLRSTCAKAKAVRRALRVLLRLAAATLSAECQPRR